MKRRALARLKDVAADKQIKKLNTFINNKNRTGIITAGTTFLSVMDVLKDSDKLPDILKLALVYPLQMDEIVDFLNSHDEVKILEELDDIIEKEIKSIAYERNLKCRITGKTDPEDFIGEYTPDKVRQILSRDFPQMVKSSDFVIIGKTAPIRPPQMCPGCGHRSAFYAIKKALKETDIKVGDICCHTLGFLPPYNMVELFDEHGASTGIASEWHFSTTQEKLSVFLEIQHFSMQERRASSMRFSTNTTSL